MDRNLSGPQARDLSPSPVVQVGPLGTGRWPEALAVGPEQSFLSPTSRREVSRSHTLTLALSSGVRALRPPVPPPGPLAVILGDAAQTAERRKVPLALAVALALTLAGLPRPRAAHPPPPPQPPFSPRPWQPIISFASVRMVPVLDMPHTWDHAPDGLSCFWFLSLTSVCSRSVHVVVNVSALLLFMAE